MVLNADLSHGTEWFCQRIPWYNLHSSVQEYHPVAFEPYEEVLWVNDALFKEF